MLIVAGLCLRNLEPRVWDSSSAYYLPALRAVMASYAEFHSNCTLRTRASKSGIRKFLNVPRNVRVYLDNGAFYFARKKSEPDFCAYRRFIRKARPDWYPIPFDSIPTPAMASRSQRACFNLTMRVNRAHYHDGYVPVVHVGAMLEEYVTALKRSASFARKDTVALGGIVPNLLRGPSAASYDRVLECLVSARRDFSGKKLHVFGIGGTATVHLATLLGFNSADSSGWRNRAARGIIQLPGHGDRIAANLGNWRGRALSSSELKLLEQCGCPVCTQRGVAALQKDGLAGFCNRAAHNLYVLLAEAEWVDERLRRGTYETQFRRRLKNSTYLPLIEQLVAARKLQVPKHQ